jgi:hypothetical protein
MKQTRQAVYAIKQYLYLDVYGWHSNNCLHLLNHAVPIFGKH